jgi:hypothetical protein
VAEPHLAFGETEFAEQAPLLLVQLLVVGDLAAQPPL